MCRNKAKYVFTDGGSVPTMIHAIQRFSSLRTEDSLLDLATLRFFRKLPCNSQMSLNAPLLCSLSILGGFKLILSGNDLSVRYSLPSDHGSLNLNAIQFNIVFLDCSSHILHFFFFF